MRPLLAHVRNGLAMVSTLGWTVLAFGALAWIAGAILGWDELMVIVAMVIVLAVTSILFTVGRLDLESTIRVEPSRVVVGERAGGELTLRNKRSRTARNLRVELPVGRAVAVYSLNTLKGGEETDELFVVPTNRRAVIPVGPTATVQGDPLGMLRRTRVWSDIDEIFVHPKTVQLSTMASGLIRDMEGQATSQLSPSDVAFHTLREYVAGDDRRHVHWKSSAKIGQLMVRQYVDTRRSHVAVLLSINLNEYVNEDEFELGVSCAASAALQALRDDQTLSLFAGSTQIPTSNPKAMLDHFSAIEGLSGSEGLDRALTAARTLAPDASVAVMCVGSGLGVPEIRQASTRIPLDTTGVVLRADLESELGYQMIGTSRFVTVPELDQLGRGLAAVL